MGSAKVSIAKPQTMENKSFKPLSMLKSLFHIDKKKEKPKDKPIDKQNEAKPESKKNESKNESKKNELKVESEKKESKIESNKNESKKNEPHKCPEATVATILEPFKKLELETKKAKQTIKQDDERDNFTVKVIEEDRRSNRIDSQSSEDSGFADNDVAETLEKLTLQDKEEETEQTETKDETKKTRKVKVVVKRTPVRTKISEYSAHPYAKHDDTYKPISQINKQTLSGGQLIVNTTAPDTFELDVALQNVAKIYDSNPTYWEDLLDVISNDSQVDFLSEFPQISTDIEQFHSIDVVPEKAPLPNPIEEFSASQHLPNYEEGVELSNSILHFENFPKNDSHSVFPTPPRSENVPSPLSESQAFYTSNSDYTLSPERSSPIYNSDFEKYQEISPVSFDEFAETKRDDNTSQMALSSMTMKNFKDLQKEIANEFSKKECCDINRKPTKELFEEHMKNLKAVERKNLCLKVSKLDLKTAYGVIHNTLLSLSKECDQEDLLYTLFALVCQRVLAQTPSLFVGDFGLSILKAAALRCPHRPLLTRHIVHCVYLVLRSDPKLCVNECVFHEVDAQGDNLVIACARAGDAYALVLSELTRSDSRGELPPLFRLHHTNADGYTALHVACRLHGAGAGAGVGVAGAGGSLHVVHALLDHGEADLWKGDIKGGDTALHLAVNSSTCDLRLVVTLFKHLDRKLWKKLAHAQNISSVTPLDYARLATKSTTRQNYPTEVLDFLKKCR